MSDFDLIEKGLCPNGCGSLTILKKPISKLLLIPEDLCDLGQLEGTETPMDMFGYVTAVCSECGFVLSTEPNWEYDYDEGKWRKCSEQPTSEVSRQ